MELSFGLVFSSCALSEETLTTVNLLFSLHLHDAVFSATCYTRALQDIWQVGM